MVTWPTSRIVTPRSLATRISSTVTARTWLGAPGTPSTASEWSVCTESTAQTRGSSASMAASTDSRRVSASTRMGPQSTLRRSARPRTWAGDSSPVTSMAASGAGSDASAWSTRVLLPIPGSPPISTSEPGTSPPPSTRSSSPMPVGRRSCAASRSSARRGASGAGPSGARRAAVGGVSSATVPHSPHDGQRPSQRGAC